MDHYTNEELINFCFSKGDLTPLEVELLHRLEDLMYATMDGPGTPPDPEWVQLMFPECMPDGDNARR